MEYLFGLQRTSFSDSSSRLWLLYIFVANSFSLKSATYLYLLLTGCLAGSTPSRAPHLPHLQFSWNCLQRNITIAAAFLPPTSKLLAAVCRLQFSVFSLWSSCSTLILWLTLIDRKLGKWYKRFPLHSDCNKSLLIISILGRHKIWP